MEDNSAQERKRETFLKRCSYRFSEEWHVFWQYELFSIYLPIAVGFSILYFVFKLKFWESTLILLGLYYSSKLYFSASGFPGLNPNNSRNFYTDIVRGETRVWFCSVCNKGFDPTHWLVQANPSEHPSYIAQCPFCKGGHTRWATHEQEKEYDPDEGRAICKICGKPVSLACHNFAEDRERVFKGKL